MFHSIFRTGHSSFDSSSVSLSKAKDRGAVLPSFFYRGFFTDFLRSLLGFSAWCTWLTMHGQVITFFHYLRTETPFSLYLHEKKTIEQLTWTELYPVLPSCFAPRSRPYPSPTFVCWARIATPSPSRIDASWWRPSASRPPSLPPPAGPHFSCLFNRVPLPCSGLLTVGKLTWLEKTVGQVNRVGWREITSVQSTA